MVGRTGLAAALTLALLAGAAAAQEVSDGREIYVSYCASCHGIEGRGDGTMAGILTILPADLTRLSAGNGGVFPTLRVARQIDGRDPMLAHGGVMPLFGDFFEGTGAAIRLPSGQPLLTSQPIADLLAYLDSVQE